MSKRRNNWHMVGGLLGGVVIGAAAAWAEDPQIEEGDTPHPPFTVTIYAENDSEYFLPNDDSDRFYTSGVAVSFSYQPQWAEDIETHMPFAAEFGPARTAGGFIFGHQIYTPEDLYATAVVEDDQPYAGYMFLGGYWQRANDETMDHFQLDIGMVGPSARGEDIQKWAHDVFDGTDPKGWDNQLHDEPTINLFIRKKWRWDLDEFEQALNLPVDVQVLPQLGGAVGTVHRYFEWGGTLRFGFNLPDDFGPGRLADVAAATGGPPKAGWGIYGFGRATGRVVEHNIFIEGNNFTDSHSQSLTTLIGEYQYGVSARYQWKDWALEVGYSQTYITRQFDRQAHNDSYGAYTLSIHGKF